MKKILLALSSCILLITASCTKEIDDKSIDVSKPVYLQESYWMLTSLIENLDYDNEDSPDKERFPFLNDCIKDDVYEFETTSNFSVAEHHLKCNASNPDKTNYFYAISNNDSHIKIWSNPDDIDNSIYMQGTITTINTRKFTIKTVTYNKTTEKNEMRLYTYETYLAKPKDKK